MLVSLSKAHRKLLETTTAAARVLAESACRAALENLAVHEKEYRGHMSVDQRKLRNRLRARGRAIGDARDTRTGLQDIHHLIELAAYEHWHRLLFTRFLTENHLLITDEANGFQPITLEECEELAPELKARDGFDLACRFASLTLPGVFRRDDPVLDLSVALNDQVELRKLLAALPSECFRADDALGWTYQFWQAQRKEEVNASGKKISADELAPVTQLFTEDYMVEFLLHNTLGAWWAGKVGMIRAASETEARSQAALPSHDGLPAITWTYLRFIQDQTAKTWLPASGTFDAWPKSADLIRLLDPCMGSGHFLVFALPLLARLRMEEEKLSAQEAVFAVLRDNIHGLELDERCTQIAAFNVALTSWKLAGHQTLPPLHLACSGLAPRGTEAEWMAVAGKEDRLRRGMIRLHSLFKHAPVLGSLINPRGIAGDLIEADFYELAPLLELVLKNNEKQKTKLEDDVVELGVIAQGLAKAAELLSKQFTLVTTNVPYLGIRKQDDVLRDYCERFHKAARHDLATVFIDRLIQFSVNCGAIAVVSPQTWLLIQSYKTFRERLLREETWQLLALLGSGAFETISGEVVKVGLLVLNHSKPAEGASFLGIDASAEVAAQSKASYIRSGDGLNVEQARQFSNPDSRVIVESSRGSGILEDYAQSLAGIQNGDSPRFLRFFWELSTHGDRWVFQQSAVIRIEEYGGFNQVIDYDFNEGHLRADADWRRSALHDSDQRGKAFWGKRGVAVSRMAKLPCALYLGTLYDQASAVIVPDDIANLPAIWAFCTSENYVAAVRKLDPKLGVTSATVVKVPFDLADWKEIANKKYPNGLPKPYSSDPTQWIFNGHPKGSGQPLHGAVARLLGYRWPRQTGSSFADCPALGPDGLEHLGDGAGIVCLPPVSRERTASARLRQLLSAALGGFDERSLITASGPKGSKSATLEDWLRDEFFEQHVQLFEGRPFIWHVWDGLVDGFHALANYHKLDHAALQKLTYSYLGDWIQRQVEDARADKPGAAKRLGASRALQTKLAAILEGEAPFDIFVRWKPLGEQAQNWHPDLNDGIRQNIRPFLLVGDVGKKGAGIFRAMPLNLKSKDKGSDPPRSKKDYPWLWCEEEPGTDPKGGKDFVGNRWNDVHLTLDTKQKARGE